MALSLSNLCFVNAWFAMLYDADAGFFNKVRVTPACLLALACNILLFGAVFWLATQVARRVRHRFLQAIMVLAMLGLFLPLIEFIRTVILNVRDGRVLAFARNPLTGAAAILLLGLILWRPAWVVKPIRALLAILAPLALLVLGRVLLLLLHVQTITQHSAVAPVLPPCFTNIPSPRVVWIVFDELDQRLGFDERPPGLKLPEFDRLCSQSICANHAYPPAGFTIASIPGLLTGQMVTEAKPVTSDDMIITLSPSGQTVRWSQMENLFGDAHLLGFNSAVVGYYIPYDRFLRQTVSFCKWYPYPVQEPSRAVGFARSLVRQVQSMVPTLHLRSLWLQVYQSSLEDSLHVVASRDYGLVFLHVPIPHPPSIYSPERSRLTMVGKPMPKGYFDNLQLADLTLGKIRQAMEQAGLWDRSWLLISSDHAWRSSSSYDGKTDPRVPFVLKPPAPGARQLCARPFNTAVSRSLILSILRGEIREASDAIRWLENQPSSNPTNHPPSLIPD